MKSENKTSPDNKMLPVQSDTIKRNQGSDHPNKESNAGKEEGDNQIAGSDEERKKKGSWSEVDGLEEQEAKKDNAKVKKD